MAVQWASIRSSPPSIRPTPERAIPQSKTFSGNPATSSTYVGFGTAAERVGAMWADQRGRLYETYHSNSYNATAIDADIDKLRADPAVLGKSGISEYLSGGKTDPKLLVAEPTAGVAPSRWWFRAAGRCPAR
jgi:hypothetical protein